MCFSATASFTAAGLTAIAGIFALSHVKNAREWPLAAIPLVFAVQQGIEGMLWLDLLRGTPGMIAHWLAIAFLFIAEVVWPLYAPAAAFLVETEAIRRRWMAASLIVGAGLALYYAWWLSRYGTDAAILGKHIIYATEPHSDLLTAAYFFATGFAMAISSHRAVVLLGLIVLTGAIICYFLYWDAYRSIWCFFGATASAAVVLHFEIARRRALLLHTGEAS